MAASFQQRSPLLLRESRRRGFVVASAGNPLQALALVDKFLMVCSANLTDDAFNRNLEVGLLVKDRATHAAATAYIENLILKQVIVTV